MARHVTVSSIGAAPILQEIPPNDQGVERMIEHLQKQLDRVLSNQPDLIVVPESCDIAPNHCVEDVRSFCRVRGDRIFVFFAQTARSNNTNMIYTTILESEDGTWHNAVRVIDRKGNLAGRYDKNHPTIGEIEEGIVPGTEAPLIDMDFGRVACAICFDLNFDELRLQYVKQKPDLIVFPSMFHGGLMQAQWAYTCRAHFVGAIAGGLPSEIISPMGNTLAMSTNYTSHVTATINLDCELVHFDYHWEKLEALKKKYGREVTIFDPSRVGSLQISSESDSVTVDQMLDEFKLERLDDYLNRSRDRRADACP